MTVENISWSISTKECCWPQRRSNSWPGLQSDAHPTEPQRPAYYFVQTLNVECMNYWVFVHDSKFHELKTQKCSVFCGLSYLNIASTWRAKWCRLLERVFFIPLQAEKLQNLAVFSYKNVFMVTHYNHLRDILWDPVLYLPQYFKNTFVLFVLRFYDTLNRIGSCWARPVYLTTLLLGRLSPLSG